MGVPIQLVDGVGPDTASVASWMAKTLLDATEAWRCQSLNNGMPRGTGTRMVDRPSVGV